MKIEIKHTYEIDMEREIKRIETNFKGDQKKRLLEILLDFSNSKFQECIEKIQKLGYDDNSGCPEIEFLPIFLIDSINSLGGEVMGFHISTKNEIIITK